MYVVLCLVVSMWRIRMVPALSRVLKIGDVPN